MCNEMTRKPQKDKYLGKVRRSREGGGLAMFRKMIMERSLLMKKMLLIRNG